MNEDQTGPIEEVSGEVPPISSRRRRAAIISAWIFVLVIVGFLIVFIATYSQREEPRGNFFGGGTESSAWAEMG